MSVKEGLGMAAIMVCCFLFLIGYLLYVPVRYEVEVRNGSSEDLGITLLVETAVLLSLGRVDAGDTKQDSGWTAFRGALIVELEGDGWVQSKECMYRAYFDAGFFSEITKSVQLIVEIEPIDADSQGLRMWMRFEDHPRAPCI